MEGELNALMQTTFGMMLCSGIIHEMDYRQLGAISMYRPSRLVTISDPMRARRVVVIIHKKIK